MALQPYQDVPHFDQDEERCRDFLLRFAPAQEDADMDMTTDMDLEEPKYMAIMRDIQAGHADAIEILVDDLLLHFGHSAEGEAFVDATLRDTQRYIEVFSTAVDGIMAEQPWEATYDEDDPSDVIHMHRMVGGATDDLIPKRLRRRYELRIVPSTTSPFVALRDIKAKHIGALIKAKGIVTRISEVKPMISVATYLCDTCVTEVFQEVQTANFMPELMCNSEKCRNRKKGPAGTLHFQARGSKFVRYQECKIQEMPEEVPVGHVPRQLSVVIRGTITRLLSPGDVATVAGIFLPKPYAGFKAMRAGLITDTYFEAQAVEQHKKSYTDYALENRIRAEVDEFAAERDAYGKLARSIAPEIFGHEDVKKALLLQMVGGVTRNLADGMQIRGDINICLMGDPGVAKSQLLKHICKIAPRGIYTSGKGSSGVGLTAAVLRDPLTKEFVLEGGSLVLADMGICCIDEFDKMEEADRTAIHEVMEQQTISIAKAGITTTLNARTAILAAANPLYGRYNPKKTPAENINLPPALLSRFDVMFLLLDKPSYANDIALAMHITHVHRVGAPPQLDFEPKSPEFIRSYIARAREFHPFVPRELTDYIVNAYVNIRDRELSAAMNSKAYTTARTLLGILRLAQALARLRFDELVSQADVDEAMRLMESSKASLEDDEPSDLTAGDLMSKIFRVIRDYMARNEGTGTRTSYEQLSQHVLMKGYSQDQFRACIQLYEEQRVWIVLEDSKYIEFCD